MEIKKTLDHMPRLIFWRVDEAFIFIFSFTLSMLFGSLLLFLGSIILVLLYRKFRKKSDGLNLKAMAYWVFGAGFPRIPSYIRKFRR
jgi:type IV conjugative transfer system protein TraL